MRTGNGLVDRLRAAFAAFSAPTGETTEVGVVSSADKPITPWPGLGSIGDWYFRRIALEQGRMARYRDYEVMDQESGEIQAVLDLVADEATQADRVPNDAFTIETEETKIKDFLMSLLRDRLGLVADAWAMARDLAKYGDEFGEIIVDTNKNIQRLKSLDRHKTFREQDAHGLSSEMAFSQRADVNSQPLAEFTAWQVVHFRNRRSRKDLYGYGWAEPARKVWKQLSTMEDGVIISRLTRSQMRYGIMVDTGELSPDEAFAYIEGKVKPAFKKRRMIDPATGKLSLRDSPLHAEEDLFLPQPKDGKSDIKVLQGATNLGQLADLEYFRNKLYSSMKVPKAFLGLEADTAGKNVIHEIEVSWARSVRRVQVALQTGLKELTDTALVLKGVDISRLAYAVVFPPISTIDELREWQVEQIKAAIANVWGSQLNVVSTNFLLKKYLGMTDEQIEAMKTEEKPEKKAFSFGHEDLPGLPQLSEVRRDLRLRSMLDTLKLLVDWELEGQTYERTMDPARPRMRTISLPHELTCHRNGRSNGASE